MQNNSWQYVFVKKTHTAKNAARCWIQKSHLDWEKTAACRNDKPGMRRWKIASEKYHCSLPSSHFLRGETNNHFHSEIPFKVVEAKKTLESSEQKEYYAALNDTQVILCDLTSVYQNTLQQQSCCFFAAQQFSAHCSYWGMPLLPRNRRCRGITSRR